MLHNKNSGVQYGKHGPSVTDLDLAHVILSPQMSFLSSPASKGEDFLV
jgi:hypothetical protein